MSSIILTRALPAMFGAAMLSLPLVALAPVAHAQTAAVAPAPVDTPAPVQRKPMARAHETVETRINQLHASLQITPAEDPAWQKVAQSMRDNEAAQLKMEADRTAHAPSSITAVQHMKNYQEHMQLHLDGLKSLTVAFDALYDQMPAPQKLVADKVFSGSRGNAKAGRG